MASAYSRTFGSTFLPFVINPANIANKTKLRTTQCISIHTNGIGIGLAINLEDFFKLDLIQFCPPLNHTYVCNVEVAGKVALLNDSRLIAHLFTTLKTIAQLLTIHIKRTFSLHIIIDFGRDHPCPYSIKPDDNTNNLQICPWDRQLYEQHNKVKYIRWDFISQLANNFISTYHPSGSIFNT